MIVPVDLLITHQAILNQNDRCEEICFFYDSKTPATRFRKENIAANPVVMSTARVITGLLLVLSSSNNMVLHRMIAAYMKSNVREDDVQMVGENPIMIRVIRPSRRTPAASNPRR